MNIRTVQKKSAILDAADFDIEAVFDCGQCFRWERDGEKWHGVAFGRPLTVWQRRDALCLEGANEEEAEKIWKPYFDLNRDYGAVKDFLSDDPILCEAIRFAPGIHILRQEPWETLCSFIISQNNNIPRIKGIVSRLCENFGQKLYNGSYSFPSAEVVAGLSVDDLAPLRCGFRARYILDAARSVSSGKVDFAACDVFPVDKARDMLMQIKGVGPKVADCTLLFGCGRFDCFPVDVWIKRVLKQYYPQGFPQKYARFGGIAQQYLFYYARSRGIKN